MRRIPTPAWRLLLPALLAVAAGCGNDRTTRAPGPARKEAQRPAPPKPKPKPKKPASLVLATYNVCRDNLDLEALAAMIAKSKADLVCLQEVNRECEKALRKKLGKVYPHMIFKYGRKYNGFAFLSKRKLENLQRVKPVEFFNTWIVETELVGRRVQIANVHLHALNPRKGNGLTEVLKALWRTEGVRAKEIANIHKHLKKDIPAIIAGDLNSLESFAAPRYLKSKAFVDSFAAVTKDPNSHITWFWRWKGQDLGFRIDYIFHPKSLRTLESRVLKSKASDHYLLVSKLAWTPKALPTKAIRPAAEDH